MELINHGLSENAGGIGIPVIFPALGVGGGKVDDHGPLAVDTGGPGIGVAGFGDPAFHVHQEGVIGAVEVSGFFGNPGTVLGGIEGQDLQKIVCIRVTAVVQLDPGSLCSGGPESEIGFIFGPYRTQIGAGIGVFLFKCLQEGSLPVRQ